MFCNVLDLHLILRIEICNDLKRARHKRYCVFTIWQIWFPLSRRSEWIWLNRGVLTDSFLRRPEAIIRPEVFFLSIHFKLRFSHHEVGKMFVTYSLWSHFITSWYWAFYPRGVDPSTFTAWTKPAKEFM